MPDNNPTESQRLRQEKFERVVERHHGHNFRMMVVEGSLFIAGTVMFSGATVLSGFLNSLGAEAIVIGLVMGLFPFVWTSVQIYAAFLQGHLPRKRRSIMAGRLVAAFFWMLLGTALVYLYPYTQRREATGVWIWALLITVVCFALLGGYTVPLWLDFVGKIFRPESRGRFYGWRNGLGALVGLVAAGLILPWLLRVLPFPYGYAAAFAAGGAFTAIGALFLGRSREAVPPELQPKADLRGFVSELISTWRTNRSFRFFIFCAVLSTWGGVGLGGGMAMPFFMRKAQLVLGAEPFYVGVATAVLVGGQVVSALVGGWSIGRVGPRATYFAYLLLSLAASLLALLINVKWPFLAVFFLAGAARGAGSTSYHNCILEMVPEGARAQGIGLINFMRSPLVMVMPVVGGFLLAKAGYAPLFLTAAVGAVVNLGVFLFGVGLRRPAPAGG